MIQAKIIADSKNEFGNRITTMIVTFPRFILAELNTHRMFSRNSASSRAIPFEKMVESVDKNPFIPIAWQKNHKGMQGTEYWQKGEMYEHPVLGDTRDAIDTNRGVWNQAISLAIQQAKYLNNSSKGNVTKQLCNRLLEPFMWHTVIITATEWENFFALRCPQYQVFVTNTNNDGERLFKSKKDLIKQLPALAEKENDLMFWLGINKGQAEIHMMALAEAMWDAYNESTPKELKAGEWHIPFSDDIDTYTGKIIYEPLARVKIATAMCARVSYTVVGEEGKEPNLENDLKLHDRLAESGHWSPFEHCAKVPTLEDKSRDYYTAEGWCGNFKGFIQYRKTFQNENITKNGS